MGKRAKWIGGYRHPESDVYFIYRQIRGVRYHFSTGTQIRENAIRIYTEFERNPADYFARRHAARQPGQGARFGEAVQAFLEHSRTAWGTSAKHLRSQAGYFDNWNRYFEQEGIVTVDQINTVVTEEYMAWRRVHGRRVARKKLIKDNLTVSDHAIALDVSAMKRFLGWCVTPANLISENPLRNFSTPKRPKRSTKPRVIGGGVEVWHRVREKLTQERWKLCGDVMYGSTMRYASLARLRTKDVDVGHGTIYIAGNLAKGKEGTTIYVEPEIARAALQVAAMGIPPESNDFSNALKRACRAAGVPKFTPHMFRHTSASEMLASGADLIAAKERLTHASLRTTEIYVHDLGYGKPKWRGPEGLVKKGDC